MTYTLEDYAYGVELGRAKLISARPIGASGRTHKEYSYEVLYPTQAGHLTPDEWKTQVEKLVITEEKTELLKRIEEHIACNCAWLHTESEIHMYALKCLVSHSYEAWEARGEF